MHFGISIVEARKATDGREQRQLCGHDQVQEEEGRAGRRGAGGNGGDNHHTVSPPVLHQAR